METNRHRIQLLTTSGNTINAIVDDATAMLVIEKVATSRSASRSDHFVNIPDIDDNTILFAPSAVIAVLDEANV